MQHADTGWPAHFVAGEDQKIALERLHVHRQMRHALRAIHQHQRAGVVGTRGDLAHRVDRAEHIRLLGPVSYTHLTLPTSDLV